MFKCIHLPEIQQVSILQRDGYGGYGSNHQLGIKRGENKGFSGYN